MGQTAQSGQVIFATQTAPGTPVSAANILTQGISAKIRSGSLGGDRDLITPEAEIGGGRDTADAYLGGVAFSGDYDLYVRFRIIATLLANALGTKASVATGTGAWTHTITPTDGQVPFMTVYEEIGSGMERFIYSDVVINTLHLECDANGLLTAQAGMIGRLVTAGVAAIDGTTIRDNTSMVVGTNIQVKYATALMPAKSFSLDISNGFEDDNFYLGSLFLGDLTAKGREITAGALVRHETPAAMKQALFGIPTATQIGGLATKDKLEIICTAYEDIPAATPPVKFSLKLELPKVIFEPFSFEPSGDDALENDISMRAIRPDSAVKILTATVVNDKATIA